LALQQDDEEPQQQQQEETTTSFGPPLVAIENEDDEDHDDDHSNPILPKAVSTRKLSSSSSSSSNLIKLPTISIQDLVYTPQTELISGILVLLSCSLTAVSTLPHLPPFFYQTLVKGEEGIAFFLFLEFLAEWWYNVSVPDPSETATIKTNNNMFQTNLGKSRTTESSSSSSTRVVPIASFWTKQWSYFTKPLVWIDVVVVVLPVVLPHVPDTWFPRDLIGMERLFDEERPGNMAGSGLINLRLLRLLRWQRVLQDLPTFQNFQSALLGVPSCSVPPIQPYQLQLARVLVSIVTLLCVSAGLIYTTERQVNPNLSDFFTALYFTLTTLTTVGFGDITPMTPQGKMVVSASILAGIAILPAQAASLVDALWKGNNQHNEEETNDVVIVDQKMLNGVNGVKNGLHSTPTNAGAAKLTERLEKEDEVTMVLPQELELPRLNLQMKCASCGAVSHWSKASFCWSCGGRLSSP
jgi:hypothetical protein